MEQYGDIIKVGMQCERADPNVEFSRQVSKPEF